MGSFLGGAALLAAFVLACVAITAFIRPIRLLGVGGRVFGAITAFSAAALLLAGGALLPPASQPARAAPIKADHEAERAVTAHLTDGAPGDEAIRQARALEDRIADLEDGSGASDAPILTCAFRTDRLACDRTQLDFLARVWPAAWRGDNEARAQVARCYATSCSGAVKQDQVQACAWRLAMMGSGDQSDAAEAERACAQLGQYELAAAKARAIKIAAKG